MLADALKILTTSLCVILSGCEILKETNNCNRCDLPMALDLQPAGLGSPVGSAGVYSVQSINKNFSLEEGAGKGIFGTHGTINAHLYPNRKFPAYILLGLSYASGEEEEYEAQENVPDSIWANYGIGRTNQTGRGWRLGYGFGFTQVLRKGYKRESNASDDQSVEMQKKRVFGHNIPNFEEGNTLPYFLFRIGFAFDPNAIGE